MQFHTTMNQVGAASQSPPRGQFRVLQLNTLAHWACDGETDDQFEQRTELHFKHIEALAPTIVILEEVDGPLTAPRVATLPQRLIGTGAFSGVSAGKSNEKGDETWVLYRNGEASPVPLLACSEGDALHHEVIRFDEGTSSQFAISIKLHVAAVDTDVIVVGHHAKAGRTEEHERTRVRHSLELWHRLSLRYANDEAFQHGRLLLCGDFNAGPHSYGGQYPASWYPTVVEGVWAAEGGLVSAQRSMCGAEGEARSVTTFKFRKGACIEQCIDYVFHNPQHLVVCGGLALPQQRDALSQNPNAAPLHVLASEGLPSAGLWGSDHLSIAFDFTLPDNT
jgi:hypothetical protein